MLPDVPSEMLRARVRFLLANNKNIIIIILLLL